jgi:hypothetical protein
MPCNALANLFTLTHLNALNVQPVAAFPCLAHWAVLS